jgi:hypothetical protein
MDFDEFEQPAVWGVVSPREAGSDLGLVRDTLRKDQIIKCVYLLCLYAKTDVLTLSDHRDILASQEDLRGELPSPCCGIFKAKTRPNSYAGQSPKRAEGG